MSHVDKFREKLLRLMILIGLVIAFLIPVRSWAFAQAGSAPIWMVRSLHTHEYGVDTPQGLVFSSEMNTFFVLDGSTNATLITMGEDLAGTKVIPEAQADPLNTAFDKKSGSLSVFNRGNSELVQIKIDGKGSSARFGANALGVRNAQGIAFDSGEGRLFILDAGSSRILSVASHSTLGFDANKVQRISLKKLGPGALRGLAYHPGNGHLYVSEPAQKKLYELTKSGDLVSTFDLASLGINNPSAMTFAPSVDNTDDSNIYDLFLLDAGAVSTDNRIVELSLAAPAALPPGTTLLPASLVHMIDTSNASWNPSSPDPSGVDYWPLTDRLLIADSEVDEMPPYWQGKNVFQSTTSGNLGATCSTISFSGEPTGVAINPNNNHIFFSTDFNDRVFEVSLGGDGQYCTADDTVTTTNVSNLYNINDAEDVAYGNNTLFIGGGAAAEVYRIPLGANGVLGGGDDGAMTHFDTAALGFADLEGIGYNADAGTLFIVSTKATDRYLGETTPTGTLLRAYDLSLMGTAGNIRSDVTYAPGSQSPAVKNIYIASRGVDNDSNSKENDGQVWEISLGSPPPTNTPTRTPTPTPTRTPTPGTGLPGPASLISPSGSISTALPTYTWNTVSGATWYYLYVNGPSGNVIQTWYRAVDVCNAGTCSATPATTLSAGAHRWWVQTWNNVGYGPWSAGLNFNPTLPGATTLVLPSGITPDTTPIYIWNTVPAATWYYLYVDGPSGNVIQTWYRAVDVCNASTCSVEDPTILSSGAHRWWVQTWNNVGYGPWSAGLNFSIP